MFATNLSKSLNPTALQTLVAQQALVAQQPMVAQQALVAQQNLGHKRPIYIAETIVIWGVFVPTGASLDPPN